MIIRETKNGQGFFPTSVEVVEREVVLEDQLVIPDSGDLPPPESFFPETSKIGQQLRRLKQAKQEKIFAYDDYSDFRTAYFDKDLVQLQQLDRSNNVKEARKKYSQKYMGLNLYERS